jgi:predicted Zn-ribbon and HTH transcriptional regulator
MRKVFEDLADKWARMMRVPGKCPNCGSETLQKTPWGGAGERRHADTMCTSCGWSFTGQALRRWR